MTGNFGKTALLVLILIVFIGLFCFVEAGNDVMTVEANIISPNGGNASTISIEVPDYLFFGNISNGAKSEELKVYINNTGSVDVTVTPQLINSSEQVFSNLYFRKFKTSNGTSVPFSKIGSFSIDIAKPIGTSVSDEYFYVMLDLSNYTGSNSLTGHRTNVKFVAVQK